MVMLFSTVNYYPELLVMICYTDNWYITWLVTINLYYLNFHYVTTDNLSQECAVMSYYCIIQHTHK